MISDTKLWVGRPNIPNREKLLSRINDILDRKFLTNSGKVMQEFEEAIKKIVGTKHVIATCSNTTGLEIASKALGLKGEVIIPAFTFIATPHAFAWQGITPVFCDVDPVTHNIDVNKIEELITPNTTGICAVHLWGRPAEIEVLEYIARKNNLKLLFDAAHAPGCTYRGTPLGNFGDAEVFSFHATKFINSCEGGAIVTNNDELAERCRLMRNYGLVGADGSHCIGINAKMSEFSAAMGLTSIEEISDIMNSNRAKYNLYKKALANIDGIKLIDYPESEQHNCQYIVTEFDHHKFGISRDEAMELLHKENIMARRYFYPGVHKMAPYKFDTKQNTFPITDELSAKTLVLPTGSEVSDIVIEHIGNFFRKLRRANIGTA